MEHLDVLIVGAGLSGIGAAVHLQQRCPDRRFAIVEARERLGGTWDLFRYPGVRSDSDMYTLGYRFRPWTDPKAIADGPAILRYLQATAREHGVDATIRFQQRVVRADWSSADARWTVDLETGPARTPLRLSCGFLFMCSGYYRYDAGYTPDFPGRERFRGRVVHPQLWTDDIAHAQKRVVVIGSGATAVTLVPELAKTAEHVTMLQRSPTWMVVLPARDALANGLRRVLPARLAYTLTRWKQVALTLTMVRLCRSRPALMRRVLLAGVRRALGRNATVAADFTPRYEPWQQRLCLVPDGDFFKAMRAGRASVVTDTIVSFTETGIRLASGTELPADLIVTATGLALELAGGMQLSVDGKAVDWPNTMNYRGLMYSGVPNFAAVFGYTRASWTLKSDLIAEYVCRLLNHMQRHGLRMCVARADDASVRAEPWVDLSSGYLQRDLHRFPKQGSHGPWKLHQNYVRDLFSLRYGRLADGAMTFA